MRKSYKIHLRRSLYILIIVIFSFAHFAFFVCLFSVFEIIYDCPHVCLGKASINRSEGECIINQGGGLGMFGTFGDVTKAKLKPGLWKRIVIAVRNVDGKNEKGEMRTWIGRESGVVLREETFGSNGRFAIDPETFYLFSSTQSEMMPGNIAIRTLRVERAFATDEIVRENYARDKVRLHRHYYHFHLPLTTSSSDRLQVIP